MKIKRVKSSLALGLESYLGACLICTATADAAFAANQHPHPFLNGQRNEGRQLRQNRHQVPHLNAFQNSMQLPGQVSNLQVLPPKLSSVGPRAVRTSNRSVYINDLGRYRALQNNVSLNLGSTVANITVGSNLLGDSVVTIDVGGADKNISAGSTLTAAEYAALNQRLATGNQSLKLNSDGAAIDGSLNLNVVTDNGKVIRTSEFVIPQSIEVVGDFRKNAEGVRVNNALINYGSLYAVSNGHRSVSIAARDINNELGALISTDIPNSANTAKVNLALRADRDLNNAGTITSSGELELSAGNSINNSGIAQAHRDVSLNSASINNNGLVSSSKGNINITAPTDANLVVNNTGGEMRALSGNIDVATTSGDTPKTNTNLTGGNWYANELNIASGDGAVRGSVKDINAVINITGGSAQFQADTGTLKMGRVNVTGDPLISNSGDILIGSDVITNGAPLSIVSGANIAVSAGTKLDTSAANGTGGDILIVSGALFTTPSNLEITGGTAFGGSVDLTGLAMLRSGGKGSNTNNGGDIQILAFQGAVIIPTAVQIQTGGRNAGTNGDVTIVAGKNVGQTINIGSIDTTGGTGGGGIVTLAAAAPTVAVSPVVIDTTVGPTEGKILSGSFGIGANTFGDVILNGAINTFGADISLTGDGSLVPQSLSTSGLTAGNILLQTTGVIIAPSLTTSSTASGANAGSVTISGSNLDIGPITANATGTGNGGTVSITGASSGPMSVNSVSTVGGATGSSGNITIINNQPNNGIQFKGASYLAGSSKVGGTILFQTATSVPAFLQFTSATTTIDSRGTTTNGNVTFDSGNMTANNLIINANGGGSNGTVTMKGFALASSKGLSIVADGLIDLTAVNDISASLPAGQNSGDIFIQSVSQAVKLPTVNNSVNGASDHAGKITIQAGQGVTVGTIFSFGGSGVAGVGGDVLISAGAASTFGLIGVQSGGQAGSVTIQGKQNDLALPSINAFGGTTNGDITVTNLGGNGNIIMNGELKGKIITLDATGVAGGSLTLNQDISLSSSIQLLAKGNIDPGISTLIGNALTLQSSTISSPITTRLVSLSASIPGQTLTVNEQNDIQINSITLSKLDVTAGGSITTGASLNGFDSLKLNATGVGSNITLNNNITPALNGTISLSAQENIFQTAGGITTSGTGFLAVGLSSGKQANLTSATNNISQFSGNSGGTVTLNNGNNPLNIGALGFAQSLVATTTSPTGISATGALFTSGTITLNTPAFFTDKSVKAASILIQNLSGDLTIAGATGGSLTATVPAAGGKGTPSSPAAIIFNTKMFGALTLSGLMNLTGDVAMNNGFGTTTSLAGSKFTGTNNITLTTNSWVQQGTPPQITANNLIINLTPYGTLINTAGDITLSSDVTLNGFDFAIISSGNINVTGPVTINLSSTAGSGGTLTMLAGFNFSPNSMGTKQTFTPFTYTSLSAGGSISGSNLTINTSATGATGNGGSVLAVANNGSVTLGSIDTTSAKGIGGSVNIIGQTGISVGTVTTTGLAAAGDVTLEVASSSVIGTPVVNNGTISGGSFLSGPTTTGNITANAINAGTAIISTFTSGAGSTVQLNGALTANEINLLVGTAKIAANFNTFQVQTDAAGNGGQIEIEASDLTATPAKPVTFNAQGTGTGNGGYVTLHLTSTNALTFGTSDFSINAKGPASGGVVDVETGGDLIVNAGGIDAAPGTLSGAQLSLSAGTAQAATLTLNDTTFLSAAHSLAPDADGGLIKLSAPSIAFTSSSGNPLNLDASGNGLGNGGTVIYQNGSTTPTFIGPPAKPVKGLANFLVINAKAGATSGAGGTIDVEVGGPLTADSSKMPAVGGGAKANGANYTLTSGSSLVISGNLDAGAIGFAQDGDIFLRSNSKTAFSMNPTKLPKNGILGTVTGGSVTIQNDGGGIKVNTTPAITADDLSLLMNLKGTISVGKSVTITAAKSLLMSAVDGAIGKKQLLVSAPNLQLLSTNSSVNVSNVFAGPTTLLDSVAGKKFTLLTNNSVTVNNITTTAGAISITGGTGGTLAVANGSIITANDGALTITNPDINAGNIVVGNNTIVQTAGPKGGNTVISIGPAPKKGTTTTLPANFAAPIITGKGQAFFEGLAGSILGTGPGPVQVSALDKIVILSNASTGAFTIQVGDSAQIIADPPVKTAIPHVLQSPIFVSGSALTTGVEEPASFIGDYTVPLTQVPLVSAGAHSVPLQAIELRAPLHETSINLMPALALQAVPAQTTLVGFSNKSVGKFTLLDGFVELNEEPMPSEFSLIVNAALKCDEYSELSESGVESSTTNNAVLIPNRDTAIETSHGTIKIAADSVVLLMQSRDGLAVYNIDDRKKNAVVVATNGKTMSLAPGHHVTISSHSSEKFEDVNAIELVQYRRMNKSKLSNGWNVYAAEFSIPSVCFAVKPLRQLTTSKHNVARKITAHMLKTTAVIMTLNPDRGDFVQYFKTRMTAMN